MFMKARLRIIAYLLFGNYLIIKLVGGRTGANLANKAVADAVVDILRETGWDVVKFEPGCDKFERPIVLERYLTGAERR